MPVAVSTLIDQAKRAADKRSDASYPDTDALFDVNWAVESLWRFLAPLDAGLYFAQGDFTLAGGTPGSVSLAAGITWKDPLGNTLSPQPGYRALHGLDVNPDTTVRRTVPRRNFRERNRGSLAAVWTPTILATDRRYDLRGRTLVITPYESAAGTYRAYIETAPYLFVSNVDGIPLDWQLDQYHEWIPLMAGRRALGYADETDGGPHSERLNELRKEITDAHSRDDEPFVVADVEEDGWTP